MLLPPPAQVCRGPDPTAPMRPALARRFASLGVAPLCSSSSHGQAGPNGTPAPGNRCGEHNSGQACRPRGSRAATQTREKGLAAQNAKNAERASSGGGRGSGRERVSGQILYAFSAFFVVHRLSRGWNRGLQDEGPLFRSVWPAFRAPLSARIVASAVSDERLSLVRSPGQSSLRMSTY